MKIILKTSHYHHVQSSCWLSCPSAGFRRIRCNNGETKVDEKTQPLNSIQYRYKTCKLVNPDLHHRVSLQNLSLVRNTDVIVIFGSSALKQLTRISRPNT